MKLLLDTHVWIWAFECPEKIGPSCRKVLAEESGERLVSPVSTLELARLVERGHIELVCPLAEWIRRSMTALRLRTCDLDHAVAMEAYALPGDLHPDPADRILVASARLAGAKLVTADRRILAYGAVETLPAGD